MSVASNARNTGRRFLRRVLRRPRGVTDSPNLLPTLIKVFAVFTKIDGAVLEEEIDSSLGFLRYDYPDAVYSELRKLFREALHQQQDLDAIATNLAGNLSDERKILLGVQLYDLISKAGLKQEQVIAYYSFMSRLGMAAQAIDIVYQLNANEQGDTAIYQQGESPLELLSFGPAANCDIRLHGLESDERLLAYRYKDFIILKNLSKRRMIVQSRSLLPGGLGRLYTGQRILVDDQVITYQDVAFYFNAKKNVSLPQIFVAVNEDDEVRVEKNRSRDSCLEMTFGLKVSVTALRDVDAVLNEVRLTEGMRVEASLEDRIIFHNDSELDLDDLRRRARSYGGRFHLTASKSEYLVSNNPSLLHEGDILLSPGSGGDVLLKIFCDYDKKEGSVEVLLSDRPIVVRGVPIRNIAPLADGDTIRIDSGQLLRCNFTERLIEEERNIIRRLEVRDLVCRFRNGDVALDGLSFTIQRGEMVCVMGASGCGKSTLMRTLSGQFLPVQGEVVLNNRSLYTNYDALKKYITYIPQYDAFDECLTIEENLEFAAAIRVPHLSKHERTRRIENKLAELGLNERRNNVVGSPHRKTLSGGERKRLNIGLDMISSADIYLFDEPTSGLSSKDSEHVMEIIRDMSHNKLVMVTIHQPTSKIFQMFHKALLLDKGGKMVFFGTPQEMLAYFAETEQHQLSNTPHGSCEACGTTRPEFIFDVMETPLRDLSGDIIYEENNRGQLVPARRFSPDYWRDKYEAYRLAKDIQQPSAVATREPAVIADSGASSTTPRRGQRWRPAEEWSQFSTLIKRAFVSKFRNHANLLITLVEAPLLAFMIGMVLRHSESVQYDFASAFHIPTYLFLALLVAMFLGLTNSVDDIIRDRALLLRERNLNVRLGYYVAAKVCALGFFAIIQCALFTLLGNAMLAVHGFFWIMFTAMVLTAMSGVAIGLLISVLSPEGKTAVLIIPAVLIPQIIFAGALIKYEDMNRNLDFGYVMRQWFEQHPKSAMAPESEMQVPFLGEINPLRWSYEAVIYAQAKMNPLASRQRHIQQAINELIVKKDLTPAQEDRLYDLKELLAIVSGLGAPNVKGVEWRLRLIDEMVNGTVPFDRKDLISKKQNVTAEQLFTNTKVSDLVSKAEMEQSDYRETKHLNVFFGPMKEYFGIRANILVFNSGVLIVSSLIMFFILYGILTLQMRTRSA